MNLTRKEVNGVLVLRLEDERLDTAVTADLKAEFLIAFGENHHRILVNLENVKYADSSGLGALLLGIRQARELSGDFKICCANPRILNLIRIARLEDHIKNYSTESKALQSFTITE